MPFISAVGVLVDQGGTLSHGSVIAREYGLPAVTNLVSGVGVGGYGVQGICIHGSRWMVRGQTGTGYSSCSCETDIGGLDSRLSTPTR